MNYLLIPNGVQISTMVKTKLETFESIEGIALSAVVFVQDYLQFQFDSATVTINIFPTVKIGETSYFSGDAEYRNQLCSLIGEVVQAVYDEDDSFLTIKMINNSQITISRELNVMNLPELVVFESQKGAIVVW